MMKGGNIYDLQKILGHSTIGMTERYAHLSPTHLEGAMQIVNFGREMSVEGGEKDPKNVQNFGPDSKLAVISGA